MGFFVEYGEQQKFTIKVLSILLCIESLIIVLLGFMSVKQKIVYIDPVKVIGTAYIGYVPDNAAHYFALSFLYFLGNTNKYSVIEQYKSAYRLMSPQLQSAMLKTLETEADEIQKSDMSLQFTPLEVNLLNGGKIITVEVKGVRISYVYGKVVKKQKLTYVIKCQKAKPGQHNPFGLEVVSYEKKDVAPFDSDTAS